MVPRPSAARRQTYGAHIFHALQHTYYNSHCDTPCSTLVHEHPGHTVCPTLHTLCEATHCPSSNVIFCVFTMWVLRVLECNFCWFSMWFLRSWNVGRDNFRVCCSVCRCSVCYNISFLFKIFWVSCRPLDQFTDAKKVHNEISAMMTLTRRWSR